MLRYRLNSMGGPLTLELDTQNPNESVPIAISGDATLTRSFRRWLSKQLGAFGHPLGDSNGTVYRVSPIDLSASLQSEDAVVTWYPELLEGGEMIERFDPDISANAVT